MTMCFSSTFSLLTTLAFASLLSITSSSLDSLNDKEALLSIRSLITSDPTNTLSSWNNTSPICRWAGVRCDRRDRVSTLDLHGLELTGSISPHIANLSYLRFLYLQGNRFTGSIPDQISSLTRLQVLNSSSNLLQGTIPPNLSACTNLNTVDLSGNTISGTIPTTLWMLSKLQVLNLAQNQLTGPIPRSIGNLSSLNTLNLGTNNLSGPIPRELGHLKRLQQLQLSINNLNGTVPSSLYNVSSLVSFDLASNDLYGEVPSDIGFRLPKLLSFHNCFNRFTGTIPPSLHNLTKIQSIRMSHNYLVGSVPPGLDKLHDLTMYNIGFNRIVDTLDFVASLTNSTKLKYLAIDENLLNGTIPESIGDLSASLSKLYMGGNRISGEIPASIGRLTSLTLLNMSHNLISGEIPPEIGQSKQLRVLGLAGNQLSGEIPASLGNLSLITQLEMYGNELTGRIPDSFSKFQLLLSLDLSNNHLEEAIPNSLFTLTSLTSLLNLSHNSLTGPLPQEIGMLENLAVLDLSNNLLSGNIADSAGQCKSLQVLSMSNNSLSGLIPNSLGNLKGLQSLDLSSNKLSGSIPQSLEKLQALQLLNLSFNDLDGDVPVFRSQSAVYLEGNPNLCIGISSCDSSSSSHRQKMAVHTVVIITLAVFVLCLAIAGVGLMLLLKRRVRDKRVSDVANSIKGQHRMVSYAELYRATEGFDPNDRVGAGSFGSVYKGILRDGMEVAIKVLNLATSGASKSFAAECEALKNVRHRNLVKLVTLCSSLDFANNDFRALVYEFMSNGSLEDWIRGRKRREDGAGLSVVERLEIAIDVASAVDYLHNDCEPSVVHCDLKPSNVLLDAEMCAKVGDFGLARLLLNKASLQDSVTSTHGIKGSIGYIPPEYGFGGKPSTQGDVYSYGVMLLELVTGKSPTDESFVGGLSLEKWVRAAFPDRAAEVIDTELDITNAIRSGACTIRPEKQLACLVSVIGVALCCVLESPEPRSSMRDVLHQLESIKEALVKKPQIVVRNKSIYTLVPN